MVFNIMTKALLSNFLKSYIWQVLGQMSLAWQTVIKLCDSKS